MTDWPPNGGPTPAADGPPTSDLASDLELDTLVWSRCLDSAHLDGESGMLVGQVGYSQLVGVCEWDTESVDGLTDDAVPGAAPTLYESRKQCLMLRADVTARLATDARLRTATIERLHNRMDEPLSIPHVDASSDGCASDAEPTTLNPTLGRYVRPMSAESADTTFALLLDVAAALPLWAAAASRLQRASRALAARQAEALLRSIAATQLTSGARRLLVRVSLRREAEAAAATQRAATHCRLMMAQAADLMMAQVAELAPLLAPPPAQDLAEGSGTSVVPSLHRPPPHESRASPAHHVATAVDPIFRTIVFFLAAIALHLAIGNIGHGLAMTSNPQRGSTEPGAQWHAPELRYTEEDLFLARAKAATEAAAAVAAATAVEALKVAEAAVHSAVANTTARLEQCEGAVAELRQHAGSERERLAAAAALRDGAWNAAQAHEDVNVAASSVTCQVCAAALSASRRSRRSLRTEARRAAAIEARLCRSSSAHAQLWCRASLRWRNDQAEAAEPGAADETPTLLLRRLAFTRYSFTMRLLCTNQSSLYCFRPPALLTLLRYYCPATAQYTTPS